MSTSRRPALIVFWASVAVLLAGVLYLAVLRWQAAEEADIESVGTRPTFAAPTATPSAPAPSESASPSPSASVDVYVPAPERVRIPAIDVDTKVFPVALDENRAIEIPEDIRYVGWYELGVPPGVSRGSAVLVAHRDGREQGRGVFYFLGDLTPGDRVYVTTSEGLVLPYKVVSRELIQKQRLPYEELFAVDGDPRLTLISCGGYYDPDNGGYQDNVVVTAVPLFQPVQVPPIEPTPTASPSAEPTSSVTSTAEPVAVSAPQAARIEETSEPVLLAPSAGDQ